MPSTSSSQVLHSSQTLQASQLSDSLSSKSINKPIPSPLAASHISPFGKPERRGSVSVPVPVPIPTAERAVTEPPTSGGKKKKKDRRKEQREREWSNPFEDHKKKDKKEAREQRKKRKRAERAMSASPQDVVKDTPEKKEEAEDYRFMLEQSMLPPPKTKAERSFHEKLMRGAEKDRKHRKEKAKKTHMESQD